MNTITRISEVLFQKYGYYVPLAEIGYESHLFYKEEIDEQLVPMNIIEHLEGQSLQNLQAIQIVLVTII